MTLLSACSFNTHIYGCYDAYTKVPFTARGKFVLWLTLLNLVSYNVPASEAVCAVPSPAAAARL